MGSGQRSFIHLSLFIAWPKVRRKILPCSPRNAFTKPLSASLPSGVQFVGLHRTNNKRNRNVLLRVYFRNRDVLSLKSTRAVFQLLIIKYIKIPITMIYSQVKCNIFRRITIVTNIYFWNNLLEQRFIIDKVL